MIGTIRAGWAREVATRDGSAFPQKDREGIGTLGRPRRAAIAEAAMSAPAKARWMGIARGSILAVPVRMGDSVDVGGLLDIR
jgi:hypothetical protein